MSTFTGQVQVTLPDGTESTTLVAQEKGIDVRLALDLVRLAHSGAFDVALVFSQDQDLSEAATELRTIARERNRWLKIACAYPSARPHETPVVSTARTGFGLSEPCSRVAWTRATIA